MKRLTNLRSAGEVPPAPWLNTSRDIKDTGCMSEEVFGQRAKSIFHLSSILVCSVQPTSRPPEQYVFIFKAVRFALLDLGHLSFSS